MPIELKYLDGERGVVCVPTGFVTGDELFAANAEIYSRDLAAKPYYYQLVDCDHIDGVSMSSLQVHKIAEQDLQASKYLRHCVVGIYAKEDLPFGIARMWQAFVERADWDIRVFRLRSEAVAWVKERVLERFAVHVTLTESGDPESRPSEFKIESGFRER